MISTITAGSAGSRQAGNTLNATVGQKSKKRTSTATTAERSLKALKKTMAQKILIQTKGTVKLAGPD